MTKQQVQTLIDACRQNPSDLVTWLELKAVLEGLKDLNVYLNLTTNNSSGAATYDNNTSTLNVPVYSNALSSYVPYSGATTNVNLGEFGLSSGYLALDITPTNTPTSVGTISWDTAYGTPSVVLNNNVSLQLGQEELALVHNNTGNTIFTGQVVYITGSTGELPSIALASNDAELTSSVTFGVATQNITNGSNGYVTISGIVHGINTNDFTEGAAIWLGLNGAFTQTKPIAPANSVLVGYIVKKSGGNGSIFVKIQNGYELEELHDVKITSPSNGQVLKYNSTSGLWENSNDNNSVTSVFGRTGNVVATNGDYTTAQVTESGNLYYTDARARGAISVTTFGTGGAATYNSTTGVLNIPNYSSGLSGYVQGSGTTNYVPKFTASGTIGNSLIFDNGTNVLINNTSDNGSGARLQVSGGNVTVSDSVSPRVSVSGNSATGFPGYNLSNTTQQYEIIIRGNASNAFQIRNVTASTDLLSIASTGAATFSGNVGIGVTPSAWWSNVKAIQFSTSGALWALNNQQNTFLSTNEYLDAAAATARYINNGFATRYQQLDGSHIWYTAPSGTAGSAITFAQAMTLDASGNLIVGNTSAILAASGRGNVTINGSSSSILTLGVGGVYSGYLYSDATKVELSTNAQPLTFVTNGAERMRITSGGSVGIGNAANGTGFAVEIAQNASTPRIDLVDNSVYTGGFKSNGGVATLYNSSNNALAFGTNNTERMRITSGGNVGIGTTSPLQKLHVTSTGVTRIAIENTDNQSTGSGLFMFVKNGASTVGSGTVRVDNVGDMTFWTGTSTDTERMRITSGGNVGIGTTSPNIAGANRGLSVNGTSTSILEANISDARAGFLYSDAAQTILGEFRNLPLLFRTNDTERMRIKSSGGVVITAGGDHLRLDRTSFSSWEIGVGTANGINGLHFTIPGAGTYMSLNGNTGQLNLGNYGTGTLYVSGGTLTTTNPSDERLKTNINPIEYGLTDILKLNPVTFEWKNDKAKQGKQYGFIAQQVQEIMPDLVKDGEYLGLDKEAIFTILVKAIQEQQEEINNLKSKL